MPRRNLMSAVIAAEQGRSGGDVLRALAGLRPWRWDPELERVFMDWGRQVLQRVVPAGAELPPLRSVEDVGMTLVERAAEWPKQWLREGREQGLKEGLEQERALLCRQAAARFGADTAERLAELLAPISDAERLAEVGDRLVRCQTGDEFLAVLRLERSDGSHPGS